MGLDGAQIHYLSEVHCYIEPLYQIQFRQRIKELEAQLDAEMAFTEELDKKGLLKFHIEQQFKNKKYDR